MEKIYTEKNDTAADAAVSLHEVSTSALAYLGDCVIEHCVREYLVRAGHSSSGKLNEEALRFVRACAQAAAMERILPSLSEEETAVFRRGRNVGHANLPKSATMAEYRTATGMETLFGWLDLKGETDRVRELFRIAYEL